MAPFLVQFQAPTLVHFQDKHQHRDHVDECCAHLIYHYQQEIKRAVEVLLLVLGNALELLVAVVVCLGKLRQLSFLEQTSHQGSLNLQS